MSTTGTIIDTTSLIELAVSGKGAFDPFLYRSDRNSSLALSGIEALLISENLGILHRTPKVVDTF